jgi:hypothetical protein
LVGGGPVFFWSFICFASSRIQAMAASHQFHPKAAHLLSAEPGLEPNVRLRPILTRKRTVTIPPITAGRDPAGDVRFWRAQSGGQLAGLGAQLPCRRRLISAVGTDRLWRRSRSWVECSGPTIVLFEFRP